MKKVYLSIIVLIIMSINSKCQTLQLFWGNVSSFEITAAEFQKFLKIEVLDTLKNRKIADVSKFRFIIQPLMDGPVKVAEGEGPVFNSTMKEFILSSKPGDRIVVSDIFAYVENEGTRKIPTAAVFEVK